MLTCKQFHRITLDIEGEKISRLAIYSGNDFPNLRPLGHFLLVASARRLSDWARRDEERREYLKGVIKEGVFELAIYATEMAPVTLEDIRATWAWKRDVLKPLSKRLNLTCGPSSRDANNGGMTVCEDVDMALLSWVIYGELFGHLLGLDRLDPIAKLDSVTRFRYLIYCVPDRDSLDCMSVEIPRWFMNMGHARGERYQQLSLSHAMQDTLNPSKFASDVSQLTSRIPPELDIYDSLQLGTCSKATIFVSTVMYSGRRALEVLQTAHLARVGDQNSSANSITWLQDTWAFIDQSMGPDADSAPLPSTGDLWLHDHVISMIFDLRFTLRDDLQYHLRTDASTTESDARDALADAIWS